ncbi:MAG: LacI family DNA-binding transcriptional regulator [Lachnospiraceae bacterium]
MANIQDVARHANVGVGTVSRVLSGKGYVKEETRKKVEASIAALDYIPNEMARNLFFRKSGIVAVIVPEVAHPFFSEFVNAAEVALSKRDYQMMVCNTFYESNYELKYLEMLKQQRVDGIIFGAHTSLDVSQYEKINRPIVALDRDLGNKIPCVMANHREGGRLAAEEIIRSGCKNVVQFGTLKGEDKVSTPSRIRHSVFDEIMREHGIICHPISIKWHMTDYRYYLKTAEKMFDEYPEVDGVFAADNIAMAVLHVALLRGKKVPEEFCLVGYDGTNSIGFMYPKITTIVQPISDLAEETVRLIVDIINGKPVKAKREELPVTLCVGDTTIRA